jgi:hypothetical protein
MLHLRARTVLVALCMIVGCGDDEGGSSTKDGGAAAVDTAGRGGRSGSGGGGGPQLRDAGSPTDPGTTPVGSLKEGQQCSTQNPCGPDLTCSNASLPPPSANAAPIAARFCARTCADATECEEGEVCSTFSGNEDDLVCISLEDEQFAFCGPASTSGCAGNLACVYLGDDAATPEIELVGLCVQPCEPAVGGTDAGAEPGAAAECEPTQICVETDGICATEVPRGGDCSEIGTLCTGDDVCAPDVIPPTETTPAHCVQNCTDESVTCEDGGECERVQTTRGELGLCRAAP